MKEFLPGILFIIVIGVGGLIYRNAAEHPSQPIACPLDAKLCPDGTAVGRTGSSCTFAECALPNISLTDANISFALPTGFGDVEISDTASIAAYEMNTGSSTAKIIIRRYAVDASSDSTASTSSPQATPLAVIQQTAIGGASGIPVSATSLTSSVINSRRFTVAMIERLEGVVDIAYYLARGTDVLRFDAIDTEVLGWTDPSLDVSTLPARVALVKLLTTLQVLQ